MKRSVSDAETRPDRTTRILRAGVIGIVGNGVLAALKVVAGIIAHSTAVISDGVDSVLDVVGSVATVLAARVMRRPPDIDHPYGHDRAEAIATKSLSFLIFFAGLQLAISAVQSLFSAEPLNTPTMLAFLVTGVSITGKLALAVYKFAEGHKLDSPILIADAKNMRADILISVAVLVGISLAAILEMAWIDTVTALLVSIYILGVAFRLFIETNSELMEGHSDASTYQQIFDAVERVAGAEHPHRTRIRQVGPAMIIDLDIEVDGDLPLREAHEIAHHAEEQIRESIPNVYDVLVHVEPIGSETAHESFGVSQRNLNEHLKS